MKKILFMLICLLATGSHHVCEGQSTEQAIDSLLLVLNSGKEDTNKVKSLNYLSENYNNLRDFENSKKYSEEALRLGEKLKFKKGIIDAHLNLGNFHLYNNNYPDALKFYFTALQISQEVGHNRRLSRCYIAIGRIYFAQGNYPEALKNYSSALNIFLESKDSMGLVVCYNNIGLVYDQQSKYPEALASHFKVLKIAEAKGNKYDMADAYTNSGVVYWHQGNYPDALKAQFAALAIFEKHGDKLDISACYANIGMIYTDQNDLEKAKEFALKSLAIDEELGYLTGISVSYCSLGHISHSQGNYTEALTYHFKALKIHQEIGDTFNIVVAYIDLGRTYSALVQFKEAEAYLEKGLFLAKKIGTIHPLREIYEILSAIYKNQNDFKNAYKYHELFYQMNDSIFNEVKSQQIEELKVQYETEKKENEIALLNKDQALHLTEIKKQKILKILFMGGLALTSLLVYFGYLYFRNYQKLKVQTMRNKIASNLHDDVGSTLTSIRLYSEIGKKQTTDPQVSSVFDKIGQNAGEVIHSMGDIVWMINPKYDAFGSVFARMENFASEMLSPLNIRYSIKKDNEVESIKFTMAERQNIFMIFKEAIHNAAKHANCKAVAIHLSRNRDQLQMNITDDGSGFDEQAIQRGNGLTNMENRASEMRGTITVAASLGRGTSVTLNMLV